MVIYAQEYLGGLLRYAREVNVIKPNRTKSWRLHIAHRASQILLWKQDDFIQVIHRAVNHNCNRNQLRPVPGSGRVGPSQASRSALVQTEPAGPARSGPSRAETS
jgi:hypothetical protein